MPATIQSGSFAAREIELDVELSGGDRHGRDALELRRQPLGVLDRRHDLRRLADARTPAAALRRPAPATSSGRRSTIVITTVSAETLPCGLSFAIIDAMSDQLPFSHSP